MGRDPLDTGGGPARRGGGRAAVRAGSLLDAGGARAGGAGALAKMRRPRWVSALAGVWAVYQSSSHPGAGNIDVPPAVIIPRRDRVVPPTRQHTLAAAVP